MSRFSDSDSGPNRAGVFRLFGVLKGEGHLNLPSPWLPIKVRPLCLCGLLLAAWLLCSVCELLRSAPVVFTKRAGVYLCVLGFLRLCACFCFFSCCCSATGGRAASSCLNVHRACSRLLGFFVSLRCFAATAEQPSQALQRRCWLRSTPRLATHSRFLLDLDVWADDGVSVLCTKQLWSNLERGHRPPHVGGRIAGCTTSPLK